VKLYPSRLIAKYADCVWSLKYTIRYPARSCSDGAWNFVGFESSGTITMPVGRRGAEAGAVDVIGGWAGGTTGASPAAWARPQAKVTVQKESRNDFIRSVGWDKLGSDLDHDATVGE